MKKQLNVGFMVTVSGRWPRDLPERRFEQYGDWAEKNLPNSKVFRFERLVSNKQDTQDCIEYFKKNQVDLVMLVIGVFTGDDVCCAVVDALHTPIMLWAPREEKWERQDRLYANGLCCATMNGASLKRIGAEFHIVFGNKEEQRVQKQVCDTVNAYAAIKNIRGVTFGLFGYRPTAFYNCAFDEVTIRKTFGINVEETDLKVVCDEMAAIPFTEVEAEMKRTAEKWDTSALPEGHLENHARLYLALKKLMPQQGYDYAAIKCWPEMGNLHMTPCAVLGRLADEGLSISCEGDMDAGLAAVAENTLTGLPTFICDLIDLDENENTVTFWHCGNAAPSLHNEADGVTMCNHPLAGQGTAFWCSLKSGPVTAARFANVDGSYKLFLLPGEAVPTVRNTRGSMVKVKIETPVLDLVNKIAENGMSHHYSLVWKDEADELRMVAKLLNIPVIEL